MVARAKWTAAPKDAGKIVERHEGSHLSPWEEEARNRFYGMERAMTEAEAWEPPVGGGEGGDNANQA